MIVSRRTERTRPANNEEQIAEPERCPIIGKVTGCLDLEDENNTPVHSLVDNNNGKRRLYKWDFCLNR